MYDLVIAGAKLLDPVTGIVTEGNSIALNGERIAEVFTSGESHSLRARSVIDAGGRFVFPGFIDFHVHIFRHGSTFGMDADKLLSSGVTRAVDMGSAGWINYPAMYHCDIAGKKLKLSTYINISPVGQPGKGISEPLDDNLMSLKDIERIMNEYPGMIKGLKVRISKGIVKELGIKPLINAVNMGNELGLPVCVHPTDPPEDAERVAEILREGDIYSHTYNGRGSTIIDDKGNVKAGIIEARKRGVIFEVGNGRINFTYPVAESAEKAGFFPDIISSDATPATYHNGPIMWDLSRVMSKFLNLGMSLADVIKAVTLNPAERLGISDRAGKIIKGYDADLVICRMDDKIIEFSDADGNTRKGRRGFVPEITILRGEKVFCAE
ncbi:MAG: amidohydrolase family protein [Synergistaceae bacterium]|nr:amidohydrolase family protein [Synergistaceae bacterium]